MGYNCIVRTGSKIGGQPSTLINVASLTREGITTPDLTDVSS